jgi:calmodulin
MSGVTEEDIKAAFDEFDTDGSGAIDSSEIRNVCEKLGVDVSKSEIDDLIKSADADGDGKIQYSEFKNAILG